MLLFPVDGINTSTGRLAQVWGVRDNKMASPKENIYADLVLQRLEDHGIKGGRQSVRDRGSGWLPRNGVFWIHQDSCTDELTAVVQLTV